jgi:hypothetical protein
MENVDRKLLSHSRLSDRGREGGTNGERKRERRERRERQGCQVEKN